MFWIVFLTTPISGTEDPPEETEAALAVEDLAQKAEADLAKMIIFVFVWYYFWKFIFMGFCSLLKATFKVYFFQNIRQKDLNHVLSKTSKWRREYDLSESR